jgi:hypothetical protein
LKKNRTKQRHDFGKKIVRGSGTFVLALLLLLSMSSVGNAVGKNAKGPDVYVIQGMLKSIGSYEGKINGKYNEATVKGVKYYQREHGLRVTGAVDSKTFESITYSYSKLKFPSSGGKNNGQGSGSGQGTDEGQGSGNDQGTGEGQGSGSGQGTDEGQGSGSGQGTDEGQGSGSGQGTDEGQGSGNGQGAGNGKDTGEGQELDEGKQSDNGEPEKTEEEPKQEMKEPSKQPVKEPSKEPVKEPSKDPVKQPKQYKGSGGNN